MVKAAAAAAGHSPAEFSGHSLRAGFLTEAGQQNENSSRRRSRAGTRRSKWSPSMYVITSDFANTPDKPSCSFRGWRLVWFRGVGATTDGLDASRV